MAEKRMFTQKIIDSDAFLEMPLSTQALYFHLNMRADDDGFINNPKRIQRTIGASDDDLKLLIAKRFVICFENGVIVIKHWRMHNTLKSDRYKPTQYQELLETLDVKRNKAYTEKNTSYLPPGNRMEPVWNQNGTSLEPQYSIDKYSVDKKSIDIEDKPSPTKRFSPPSLDEVQAYCKERKNNVDPERFIDFYASKGWKVGNTGMKDWKAAVRTWEKREDGNNAKNRGHENEYPEIGTYL